LEEKENNSNLIAMNHKSFPNLIEGDFYFDKINETLNLNCNAMLNLKEDIYSIEKEETLMARTVKKYIIEYPIMDKDLILNKLRTNFIQNPFTTLKNFCTKNKIIFILQFKNPLRLTINDRNLNINGIQPFKCISHAAEKKKIKLTNKFQVINSEGDKGKFKVFWNYKRTPIKSFTSYSSLRDFNYYQKYETEIDNKILALENEFLNLLIDYKKFNEEKFCYLLKYKIDNLGLLYKNEIILSHVLFNIIINVNNSLSNKILIIGVDNKFDEVICFENSSFRCDFILKINKILFIIELKFRSDRQDQCTNANKCIKFKQYSERTLNYLEKHHHNIYSDISQVFECGISFNLIDNKVEADLDMHLFNIDSFNRELYKSLDFVYYMRRKIKGFSKYVD
jgi:hypothetical protein